MDRYSYHEYTILLETRALAHIGIHFTHRVFRLSRTNQNSGVSIVASTMQIASAKDKNPVLSDMCFYGVVTEIWDLDYNMFNICVFKCDWVDSRKMV